MSEPVDAIEALDPVMQARTDMEGALEVVKVLLDADDLPEAAAETMRRYLSADWEKLVEATDAAWQQLVVDRPKAGG